MSSFNGNVPRDDTQLPGAFPAEDEVLRETAAGSVSQPPVTATGQSTQTDLADEIKNLASGAAITAAAFGLAAKDAAISAKDAALPVVNAATEKVAEATGLTDSTNPGYSSEQTATGVPPEVRDSIRRSGQAPEAASDAQAVQDKNRVEEELLAAARGQPSVHTVTGVPTEVTNSIRKSGQAPEAAADRQAVRDKSRMEDELLSSVRSTTTVGRETATGIPPEVQDSILASGRAPEAAADRQAVQDKSRVEDELMENVRLAQGQTTVASSGLGGSSAAPTNRPHLYTQDTGSYTGRGTAVVLGTDTERAFPLGMQHQPEHASASSATLPDFAEPPSVTTGLETRPTTELSEGVGRDVDYSTSPGATKYAEDVQDNSASADDRVPRSAYGAIPVEEQKPAREEPIVDRVPVRTSEEETIGNGPGVYNKLSSGTPSGVNV